MTETLEYSIGEVMPYINWVYFFHAWGFQQRFTNIVYVHDCPACSAGWVTSFGKYERKKAAEALNLYREATLMLRQLDGKHMVRSTFRLCRAASDGDDLLLDGIRIPLLRQQTKREADKPFLCLSDFVRPQTMSNREDETNGISNTVGVFASTIDVGIESLNDDPYKHLLIQTLSDRLAEAATEKMHEYVRRTAWGYAKEERLTIPELHMERFQGIRPAVGYPSLPDQSINFLIDNLIDMRHIGITLTENGAMRPHSSVCGLMFAHPAAQYFSVGKIGEDQLDSYAARRGMPVADIRRFLAANLND